MIDYALYLDSSIVSNRLGVQKQVPYIFLTTLSDYEWDLSLNLNGQPISAESVSFGIKDAAGGNLLAFSDTWDSVSSKLNFSTATLALSAFVDSPKKKAYGEFIVELENTVTHSLPVSVILSRNILDDNEQPPSGFRNFYPSAESVTNLVASLSGFNPTSHTHSSVDIADSSCGGEGTSDGEKLVKFRTDGNLECSREFKISNPDNQSSLTIRSPHGSNKYTILDAPQFEDYVAEVKTIAATNRLDGVPDQIIPVDAKTTRANLAVYGTQRYVVSQTTTTIDSTTPVPVTGLSNIPLEANTIYLVYYFLHFLSNGPGAKFRVTLDGTANAFGDTNGGGIGVRNSLASASYQWSGGGTKCDTTGHSMSGAFCLSGFFAFKTTTAGTMTINLLENSTATGSADIQVGSFLELRGS